MLHRENRVRRRWAQFVLKCLRLFPNPKKVIHPARTSLYMDPKCRQRNWNAYFLEYSGMR